jgi:hypothetical protein
MLQKNILCWEPPPFGPSQKRPCLMFQYQQQFNAQDDFFTAFVWTVIRASAPTFFSRRAMRIHSVDVGR